MSAAETKEATTGVARVEDLVKKALKEALDKRKLAKEEGIAPTEYMEVVKAVTEEIESTAPAMILKESQKWFSDVIGNKLIPAEQDFCVTTFHGYDWNEAIVDFIPEADTTYIIDTDLSRDILRAWELNEKILCYGPTGAGKSSLIEQLCARTARPFVRINCTGDMDSSMIFGQLTAKDGSTHWVDGSVTEAVRHGAVFAWDEWDVTPPEISMGLQWLLEDNGKLFLKEMPGATKDKLVIPHEHFKLVAIGNTQGQGDDTGSHAGTNVQNSATLDRFGTAVYVDYLPASVEVTMLLNKWKGKIATKVATELVKLANLVRQGYKAGQLNLTLSPRSLLNICKKVSFGCSLQEAFKLVYLNKLNETQHKVASELYVKVFGKN
jgi:cobaltochelatase CobS